LLLKAGIMGFHVVTSPSCEGTSFVIAACLHDSQEPGTLPPRE
jgi:hypothetical protein